MQLKPVKIEKPDDTNFILGQTHFIKSVEEVMKLAYARYSGERGFSAEQFRATAEEVAGIDLKDWFQRAVSSTAELDYTEALIGSGSVSHHRKARSPPGNWSCDPTPPRHKRATWLRGLARCPWEKDFP